MAIEQIEKDGKTVYRNTFQPTLEDGTPIGGVQVVEAETLEGVVEGTNNSYVNLYRKNRELLRADKLKAPEGVAPVAPIEFKPRPLTAEERMRLTRDLANPETIDSAADLLLEAKFGVKPQAMSHTIGTTSRQAGEIRAEQVSIAWRDAHPEFYVSPKNATDIISYLRNHNMEVTYDNLDKAYEELAPALETAPPSASRTDSTPNPATTSGRITETGSGDAQRQTEAPPLPTSMTRKTGTTKGAPKKDGITADQFRKMSNAERKAFIAKNPNYTFA